MKASEIKDFYVSAPADKARELYIYALNNVSNEKRAIHLAAQIYEKTVTEYQEKKQKERHALFFFLSSDECDFHELRDCFCQEAMTQKESVFSSTGVLKAISIAIVKKTIGLDLTGFEAELDEIPAGNRQMVKAEFSVALAMAIVTRDLLSFEKKMKARREAQFTDEI